MDSMATPQDDVDSYGTRLVDECMRFLTSTSSNFNMHCKCYSHHAHRMPKDSCLGQILFVNNTGCFILIRRCKDSADQLCNTPYTWTNFYKSKEGLTIASAGTSCTDMSQMGVTWI